MTVITAKQMPLAMSTMLATDLVPDPQKTTQPPVVQLPFSTGVTAGSHPALDMADWKRAWEYDPGPTPLSPWILSAKEKDFEIS
jgi:hypothetical protein